MSRRLRLEALEERHLLSVIGADDLWRPLDAAPALLAAAPAPARLDRFEAFVLDRRSLETALADAPLEFTAEAVQNPVELSLPTPDGSFSRFRVVDSPIMALELAASFPEIKTYSGQGIDDPAATLRFDVTPAGLHAQVLSPSGAYYIDPDRDLDPSAYLSYWKKDLAAGQVFEELPLERPVVAAADRPGDVAPAVEASPAERPSGTQLRTYRLAVAATGEYTQYFGGTVAAGQAAIVTAVNRVTGIYERELAVRLQLVANNQSLVFTNSSTDPYSNNNGSAMLGQNQTTVDSIIGNANYDVGHVFSTGGGGVAYLGVVGQTGSKAGGVTGSSAPTGDAFWVDYVAHEMGHQFGANHSFNGVNGSAAGNRNAATAYEPGSGSTIMSYAGICGADDLQAHSDAYFHFISFEEIITYLDDDVPTVGTRTATGNLVPTVNAGPDYAIPAATPFALTATGSDGNSDPLTYGWEERDLGPAQAVSAADNGTSPILRSWNPTADPTRTFPRLPDLLNNTTSVGEKLPTTNRNLNFRVTARDQRSGGGGVNSDDMRVTVVNTGAPFQVTGPNTAVTWTSGTNVTVTWNVAGTTAAPIGTSSVKILLSADGGNTYAYTLAASTPNDGSETLLLPTIAGTSSARIKVAAVGNVFFDVSNVNFTITDGSTGTVDLRGGLVDVPSQLSWGQSFTVQYQVRNDGTTAVTTDLLQNFYLSADTVYNPGVDLLLGSLSYPDDVPAGGTGAVRSGSLALPASPPAGFTGSGPFYVGMFTDSGGNVAEQNESNNIPFSYGQGFDSDSFTLSANLPDLRGAKVVVPARLGWGQTFTVKYQVRNSGSAAATTDFVQGFYLSKNATYSGDDLLLGVLPQTADLAAGATGPQLSGSLRLPSPAPAGYTGTGPFYVLMYTDANGQVAEGNEANNAPTYGIGIDSDSFSIRRFAASATARGPLDANNPMSRPGLYDPLNSVFSLRHSSTTGAADVAVAWNGAGGVPLTGDWDGDGQPDLGVYDPVNSVFFLSNSLSAGDADVLFGYGPPGAGWTPLVGDWDGDGIDSVGLFDPVQSVFLLRNSLSAGYADVAFGYGPPGAGSTPLVGDWDGDGTDGVGLVDASGVAFSLRNALTTGYADTVFSFGDPTARSLPVVGDWDGDGRDTVGLYDTTTSLWHLRNSLTTGYADSTFAYGSPGLGWLPLVGNWPAATSLNRTDPSATLDPNPLDALFALNEDWLR